MLVAIWKQVSATLLLIVVASAMAFASHITLEQDERLPLPGEDRNNLLQKLLNASSEEQEALLKGYISRLDFKMWKDLNTRALHVMHGQGVDKPHRIYLIALRVAELLNDVELIAQTWYYLGYLYSSYDLDRAIEYYLRSYDKFLQARSWVGLVDACAHLANLYNRKQRFAKAKLYADEAIKYKELIQTDTFIPRQGLPPEDGLAMALLAKAYIAYQEGETVNAIQFGKQVILRYQDLSSRKIIPFLSQYLAEAFSIVGDCYLRVADYREAQIHYNHALEAAMQNGQQIGVASALNNLGKIFFNQEMYEDSLSYFEQSCFIFEKTASLYETANAYYHKGIVYQKLEQYTKAHSSFNHCIEIGEKLGFSSLIVSAREGIGSVFRAEGRYANSLSTLNDAEEVAVAIKASEELAEIYWLKAKTYLAMKSFREANLSIQKALDIATSQQFVKLLHTIKMTQGEIYLAEGRRKQAIQVLTEVVGELESLREKIVGGEYARFRFLEHNVSPYQLLSNLAGARNRGLDALLYAERAKSRVLYDAFTGSDARFMLKLSDAELSEELSLSREIDRLTEEIKMTSSQPLAVQKDLRDELDRVWMKYIVLRNRIISARPEGDKYTARPTLANLKNLRQLSSYKDTLFLEYSVSAEQVTLFAITINPASYSPIIKTFRLPVKSDDLASKVASFRGYLADRNPLFAESSRELYDLLIKPVEAQLVGKKTICIIPDVFLWNVPFQALQNAARRYLIEVKPIFFAPSLSVLIEMSKRSPDQRKQFSLLALANPTIPKSALSTLTPLPEAETEVQELSRLNLGPHKIAIGDSATESLLKTESKFSGVIHLATHGVLNNNNPLHSHLVLASDNSNEDGILEAYEIMQLNLNADLVVLSACETACGRIGAGEGVVGISWAFFLAGCRSAAVSQWKVNSDSTAKLMVRFYQNYWGAPSQRKMEKSQALRLASLEMMKDRRYSHPFYWAGFVLIGNDR
jgi:CHAT domain-containing protein/tetratricopeptide (TPR) repeat protein